MIGRGLLTVVLMVDKCGLVLTCVGLALLAPRGKPSGKGPAQLASGLRSQRDFSWRVGGNPARAGRVGGNPLHRDAAPGLSRSALVMISGRWPMEPVPV